MAHRGAECPVPPEGPTAHLSSQSSARGFRIQNTCPCLEHVAPGSASGFHWFDLMEIFTTAVYPVVAKERVASWTFFSSERWSHMGNTFVR